MPPSPKKPPFGNPDWWDNDANYRRPVMMCKNAEVHEAHTWQTEWYTVEDERQDRFGKRFWNESDRRDTNRCPGIAPLPSRTRVAWDAARLPLLIVSLLVAFFACFALVEEVVVPALFNSR